MTADYWIKKLNLQPHPEGGYYKEVFRSHNKVNLNQKKHQTIFCWH